MPRFIVALLALLTLIMGVSAQPPAPLNNDPSRIIVKFAEGSGVRLRADGLRSTGNVDLRGVEGVLRAPNVVGVSRLFSQTEAELDQLHQSSNLRSGTPSPDLNLYHVVALSTPTDLTSAQSVLNGLRAQPTVEDAYFAPLPAPLPAYAQTTVRDTPDFLANQDYHDPAPVGIDSAAAWAYVGGRGTGVTVVDVEYEWDFDHEDLPIDPDDRLTGGMYTGFGPDHGTAVLGQIAGIDNGFGVTGLAPDVTLKVAGTQHYSAEFDTDVYNLAQTFINLNSLLSAGDIVLIEQQNTADQDIDAACKDPSGCSLYVPVEYYSAEFDAIRTLTNNGIIVVQAAGNGGLNLDHPVFGGRFNRNQRDSGAILVGAADPFTRRPFGWSNAGSRIDVFGWGGSITTTGYGDLHTNSIDDNQDYTNDFGGTSGASPIVTSAAASLQGIAKAGNGLITPAQMRSLLRATGTPQAQNLTDYQIGSLPNLRYALERYFNTDGNLLTNIGFESRLRGWTVTDRQATDGVSCGRRSAVGACAFSFAANAPVSRVLSQTLPLSIGQIGTDDQVSLTFHTRSTANIASVATARLILFYTDGTTDRATLVIPSSGSYLRNTLQIVADKPVASVSVRFIHKASARSLWLDEVVLTVPAVNAPLPFPVAP